MDYARQLIVLLKKHIAGENADPDALILALGMEMDYRYIHNIPSVDIETLYADALWLKSQIDTNN